MGINRSRRDRTGMRDKFSLARITSAKCEAKTLQNLVDQDMDFQYLLYEGADNLQPWEETREMNAASDVVLYELGILYDTPLEGEDVLVLPMEQDADWDIISEVSEWDLVSLDGGFSDDDSWG